jgi:hypothetical protein
MIVSKFSGVPPVPKIGINDDLLAYSTGIMMIFSHGSPIVIRTKLMQSGNSSSCHRPLLDREKLTFT